MPTSSRYRRLDPEAAPDRSQRAMDSRSEKRLGCCLGARHRSTKAGRFADLRVSGRASDRSYAPEVPRLSISRHHRYLVAIAGISGLAIVVVAIVFAATEAQHEQVDRAGVATDHLRGLELKITDAVNDQEAAIHDFLLSRDPRAEQLYRDAAAAEAPLLKELRGAAADSPGVQTAVDDLEAFSEGWQSAYAEPAIAAIRGGKAIDLYTSIAADDHEAIDAALAPLSEQLNELDGSLRDREDSLDRARLLATSGGLTGMLAAAGIAIWLIRRYGRLLELDAMHAGVLNRFTEVTSFASDDTAIAASNLEALALLVHPDASVTHVLNRSKDRAIPEAISGDAIAEVLSMGGLAHCAGLVRGSMYVVDDAAAPLSVRCPVYPVDHGTLACIPLASGETVGAVHLYWERPNALQLQVRSSVVRIAEHAALGIGNRRLLAALQGQANTDPRTGLANSRAFDQAVEDALEARTTDETLVVLMLDLDHFKDFNDRFGHPGGDEALRTFAGVLRSCVRDADVAARYGGEEFAVLLPGLGEAAGLAVAERIRASTEATIVAFAPGHTARITVSIGLATAPAAGSDRATLLRAADEALYRAKTSGRNRVEPEFIRRSDGPTWPDEESARSA